MTAETDQANGVIESTAVEISGPPAVIPTVRPVLAVVPTVQAEDLVARLDVIQHAANAAMTKGVDYGEIPGTNKPTLLKPGAEKLGVLFQLDIQLVNEKLWGPGDHLTVMSRATVFHAPTGARLGFGEGLCATREKKYAKRSASRVCPSCGNATIIKGKAEYGGGWLCFAKKGGCGAKWSDGAAEIERQPLGDVDNPDLADTWNTVVKMAEKRARVDAVLAVTGASAIFTQDVEDAPQTELKPDPDPPREQPEPSPELGQDTVALVLAAIGRARMPADWLRMQLVTIGVQDVPDGQLMQSTLRKMSVAQADMFISVCDEVADSRAHA